jgi:hypothetical protein
MVLARRQIPATERIPTVTIDSARPTTPAPGGLYQLPNGDWIDLTTVKAILALRGEHYAISGRHPPRVRIDTTMSNAIHILNFESDDDAERFRDQLAGLVNGALAAVVPASPAVRAAGPAVVAVAAAGVRGGGVGGVKKRRYRINCDCGSYVWERYPPRRFMRCRGCGRSLGHMQVEVISPDPEGARSARKERRP